MPRPKGKIPRIFVRPIAPLHLSDKNWLAIEAAYDNSLPPGIRRQIEIATTHFLENAEAENTGSMDHAIARVKRMRKSAHSLLDAIEDPRGGNVTEEYVDEELYKSHARLIGAELCKLLRVPTLPFAGPNYVSELYRDLAYFVGACDLTLESLDSASRYNYWPEGGAWEDWIRRLTDILKAHDLPTEARKDAAGYSAKRASPFVKFISRVQTFLPKGYVRGDTKSKSSLAERIYKARSRPKPAVSRRKTYARVPGRNA
jgi:hypothetical protein